MPKGGLDPDGDELMQTAQGLGSSRVKRRRNSINNNDKQSRLKEYTSQDDQTLTVVQGQRGEIVPYSRLAAEASLRAGGFHEAAITTDTFFILRKATKAKGVFPDVTRRASFFYEYSNKKFPTSTLKILLEVADGYRFHTVRVILSAPGGLAAGHSGSKLAQMLQDAAHNLLRAAVMRLLELPPNTKGLTLHSIIYLFGAIAVTSIAPGVIARKMKGKTATLSDAAAKVTYEEDRNEMKRRVEAFGEGLTDDEKAFARGQSRKYLASTQENITKPPRGMSSGRSTSPERKTDVVVKGEVAGGEYVGPATSLNPKRSPPKNIKQVSLYMTEGGRVRKRGDKAVIKGRDKKKIKQAPKKGPVQMEDV